MCFTMGVGLYHRVGCVAGRVWRVGLTKNNNNKNEKKLLFCFSFQRIRMSIFRTDHVCFGHMQCNAFFSQINVQNVAF